MKKIFVLFAAAVAALLAVSCVKETVNDNFTQAEMKQVSITACAEMTKTTYSETGAFSWTKGDKISVLGDDKVFYTLTAQESGPTVEFTGDVPVEVELTGKAFYPADALHACIEGAEYDSYEFNIPEYKDLTASFSADLPMGSYTDGDGVYSFKHMTGAALLTFSNLEDYTAVEITVANPSLKLSGIFEPYTEEGLWTYGSKSAPEGGSKFIRKVAVVEGVAQVYLPYPSNLWAASTVDIVGFNAEGDEFELLTGKTMKANYDEFPRATVVPYATLAVPTYVAPSDKEDLKDVDWTSENVITYTLPADETSNLALTELNVFVSEQFMNVRVKCSKDAFDVLANPAMSVFLFDGDPVGTATYWGFWTTKGTKALLDEHTGVFDAQTLTLQVGGVAVETLTDVTASEIVWTYAIPRATAEEYASEKGLVYIGVLLDEGWGQVGALPSRGESMLKVRLFGEDEPEGGNAIDWDAADVLTCTLPDEADNLALTELKVVATAENMNVRIKCSKEAFDVLANPAMSVFLFDGDPAGTATYWGFWTTTGTKALLDEHTGKFKSGYELTLNVGGADAQAVTSSTETEITWTFAVPRVVVDQYASADGKVYLGVLLDEGWNQAGALPSRGESMLEVTLP